MLTLHCVIFLSLANERDELLKAEDNNVLVTVTQRPLESSGRDVCTATSKCNMQHATMCNVQRIPGATMSHCYAWGWAAFGSILVIAALSFRLCHQHCMWMFPWRDCLFSIGCNANHKPFRLKIGMDLNKCLYEYNCYLTHFICLPLLRD